MEQMPSASNSHSESNVEEFGIENARVQRALMLIWAEELEMITEGHEAHKDISMRWLNGPEKMSEKYRAYIEDLVKQGKTTKVNIHDREALIEHLVLIEKTSLSGGLH